MARRTALCLLLSTRRGAIGQKRRTRRFAIRRRLLHVVLIGGHRIARFRFHRQPYFGLAEARMTGEHAGIAVRNVIDAQRSLLRDVNLWRFAEKFVVAAPADFRAIVAGEQVQHKCRGDNN